MSKGILLLSFGKPAYHKMAIHMAASIKYYNPGLNITVLTDGHGAYMFHTSGLKVFDKIDLIPEKYLKRNGKIDAGYCKLMIPRMLPYDETLFLDVDGCAINDVAPMLENEKDFCAIFAGKGTKEQNINYAHWATNANAWEHFELDDDAIFYAVQSSAMFFRKGPTVQTLAANIDHYIDYPLGKLKNQWGGCIPDELVYSGVTSKLKHDPAFAMHTVFFGYKYGPSINKITETYKVLSMYGAGNLVKLNYREWYDRHMTNVMRKFGKNRLANIHYLSREKHVA